MPPRYRKRRARFQLRRFGKRRRGFARRPVYRLNTKHSRRSSRFTKKRRSYRRRYRRSRYGRRRFRRGGFKRKVIEALAPERAHTFQYGQEHTVPTTVSANGKPCVYFCCERYTNTSTINTVSTVELFDWSHVMNIADVYRSSGNLSLYFQPATATAIYGEDPRLQILFKRATQVTNIRNQSNEPIHLTAYYCRPRGNCSFDAVTGIQNVYSFLAQGFANNGLDSAHVSASTNIIMNVAEYNPFNSFDFCRNFKITAVKKRRVHPGMITTFRNRRKRVLLRPIDLIEPFANSNAASWSGSRQKYSFHKSARFILFKLTGAPAGFGGNAPQATYGKLIQETSPSVVMETLFKYYTKAVPGQQNFSFSYETLGFVDPVTATHNPQIIIPDGDVVGDEKDGY